MGLAGERAWLVCVQIGVPARLNSFTYGAIWAASYPGLLEEQTEPSGQKLLEADFSSV